MNINLDLIDHNLRKTILIKDGLNCSVKHLEELKKVDGKEIKVNRYEVRRGPSFFFLADNLEEANEFVNTFNNFAEPIVNKYLLSFKEYVLKEYENKT